MLADAFDVKLPAPTQFAGIPVLDNRKSFFAGVDEIWDLFVHAMNAAETKDFTDEFKSAFEKAIAVSGNGLAYITMGLYWIRPNIYMPLGRQFPCVCFGKVWCRYTERLLHWNEYVEFLDALKSKVSEQTPALHSPRFRIPHGQRRIPVGPAAQIRRFQSPMNSNSRLHSNNAAITEWQKTSFFTERLVQERPIVQSSMLLLSLRKSPSMSLKLKIMTRYLPDT